MSSVAGEPVGYSYVPEFHVEVARHADPSLGDGPLLVGGDPLKRGKVVCASESLRARGILDGMSMAEALDRVPEAQRVPTDMALAREASGLLRAAMREVVEAVEVEGLAGFYMRAPRERAEAYALATRLTEVVQERIGLPLLCGIAPARFAARLAAEAAVPANPIIVTADEFQSWLNEQPLERLPGVGPKTAARLAELGAVDIPGLRDLGLERLDVLLGNHGRSLWLLACGEDPKPLRTTRHPASLSREETLEDAVEERGGGEVRAAFEATATRLAEALERALRRDGLRAGRIALRLSGAGERTLTRSSSLNAPTAEAPVLAEASRDLLERVTLEGRGFRKLALVLRGLETAGAPDRQLDLF